jgi:sulfatase modifying factor 1
MTMARTEIRPNDPVSPPSDMVWVPGGTFSMGSNDHYPEEAPVHHVRVDGFWIDRTPVTNRQFKDFVKATGHKTFAEIAPDPKDYPGALPHMLYAGSLVFVPPPSVNGLRDWSQWWTFMKGADWRHPFGPKSSINTAGQHPVVHVTHSDAFAYARWAGKDLPPKPNGSSPREAGSTVPNLPGETSSCRAASTWRTPGKASFRCTTKTTTATNARRQSPRSRRTATGCTT